MAGEPSMLRASKWARALKAEVAAGPGTCRDWIQSHGQLIKQDRNSFAALIDLAGEACFTKWYGPRNRLHGLVLRSRYGRPIRNQDASRVLSIAGVAVPQPRGCLWCGDGALVLAEGLEGGADMQTRWASTEEPAERLRLLLAAAKSLAQLHIAAHSHGDSKWSNLLCHGEQVYLVDLDAVQKARPGNRRQARDMARFTLNAEELAVEPEDYEAFLADYFAITGVSREAMTSRMLPELYRLRERHRRQYGNRGRPLW